MHKDRQEIDLIITKYDLLYEQRMTRVETTCNHLKKGMDDLRHDVKDLKSDFRWMFGFMISGFAGLFVMMAHGFHWII